MKFYQSEEFRKLQNKWYLELKKSGFEDLEFYNPKTGAGHDGPYLESSTSKSPASLRKSFNADSLQHYRICRNFLAHGAFLRQKPRKNSIKFRIVSLSYRKYVTPGVSTAALAAQDDRVGLYTFTEYKLWEIYCTGCTIRTISSSLRRLYKAGEVDTDAEGRKRGPGGEPFSLFWVKKRLAYLKAECLLFNKNNIEGIDLQQEEKDAKDWSINPSSIYDDGIPHTREDL